MITLDTNILVYSVDDRAATKQQLAQSIVAAAMSLGAPIGFQVCGEFYAATTGRLRHPPWGAAQIARNFATAFDLFAPSFSSLERALAEAATGRFSFWDANLLAAAEEAGCTHIISEDMADGARLGFIEVVAPFGPSGLSERVRSLLKIES